LLIELLVALGMVVFVYPLAFLYISRLMDQPKMASVDLEMREAAANMKAFLSLSGHLPTLASQKISIGHDANGRLWIRPFQTDDEGASSDADFLAKNYDQPTILSSAPGQSQMFCSFNGGSWILCPKSQGAILERF
jgi:type II secretory pathway pseudopilin PulG